MDYQEIDKGDYDTMITRAEKGEKAARRGGPMIKWKASMSGRS